MKEIKDNRIRKYPRYYLFVAIIFSVIIITFTSSEIRSVFAGSDVYKQINRFIEVTKIIKQYYVEDVETEKLITGAINGMLEALDPHSVYIEPTRLEKVTEQFDGYFFGIGIEFIIQNKILTVVAPIPGTPSDRLGLRPGDKIIKINGKYTYGISDDDVKKKLRGLRGSSVIVTIKRLNVNDSFDLEIIRDKIPIRSILTYFMLDKKTGYVALSRFSKTTTEEFDQALEKLFSQGMQKLLLDLRSNSGGYLDQAVSIVDRFIPGGRDIVSTRGRIVGADEIFRSTNFRPYIKLPLIILINNGSASASEIVAGAIQDWDRGLIVGETSFGKGLVQSQLELEDRSALRITIARYYTPSGRLIQRSYDEGLAEYYLSNQDEAEETVAAASQDTSSASQVYWTSQGRKVYGGGGIHPDVTVKSGLLTPYTSLLLSKRLFFEFGSVYASQHRTLRKNFHDFVTHFQVTADILKSFQNFIEKSDIEVDSAKLHKDVEYIKLLLKSEIGRNLWDSDKYYQVYIRGDYQVREATKLFSKSIQLAKLSGSTGN